MKYHGLELPLSQRLGQAIAPLEGGKAWNQGPWAMGRIFPSGQFSSCHQALPRILFPRISKLRCEASSITFDLKMIKEDKVSEVGPLVSDPGFPHYASQPLKGRGVRHLHNMLQLAEVFCLLLRFLGLRTRVQMEAPLPYVYIFKSY